MRIGSRRKARELALKALYQAEIAQVSAVAALADALEEHPIEPALADFARILVVGVKEQERKLDAMLAPMIPGFDYSRLAVVDRTMLRMASFEILHLPAVPPAVSINEAIEISRKYSTYESGKFVNGVLGRVLSKSPKANWDPETAPPEFEQPEIEDAPEPEEPEIPEVEEVDLDPESPEGKKIARIGGWTLRKTPEE